MTPAPSGSKLMALCQRCNTVCLSEQPHTTLNCVSQLRSHLATKDARIREAERLIERAVEIMSPEQVGQWDGVRLWQEFPEYSPTEDGEN